MDASRRGRPRHTSLEEAGGRIFAFARIDLRFMGNASSPVFVRQPKGNGVAERAVCTLKERLLWVRHFATVEDLRLALAEFTALYNASWLRQRHGHKTPDQIRAE